MTNSILTNKVIFHKSYEEIDKLYDIVRIKTDGRYFKFNSTVFDLPLLNKNVRAVLYSSNMIFLLANKGKDNLTIIMEGLKEVKEAEKLTGSLISSKQLEDYQLLQLLLNSIWNFNSEDLKSNNVTGHLYCFDSDWCYRGLRELKDEIVWVSCIEIKIDQEMHINLPVKTFSSEKIKEFIRFGKTKYEDYPKYILNKNKTMSRKLMDDEGTEYIMRNSGKKREIPFLDLSSFRKFKKTKMGILYQTIQKFNLVFQGMASIELDSIPVTDSIESKRSNINKEKGQRELMFINKGINIIDLADDEESKLAIETAKNAFNEVFNETDSLLLLDISEKEEPEQSRLNVVIMHEKNFYNEEDPYKNKYKDCVIQHITIEEILCSRSIKHIIRTLANELLVKNDISNGKISLYDWKKLGLRDEAVFISKQTDNEENIYYFMTIQPDGSFNLFARKDFDAIDKYTNYLQYFLVDESIDNLIINQDGNVISIWDTGWITIPNIEEIASYLKEGNNKLKGKEKRKELLEAVTDIKELFYQGEMYYYVGVIGDGMQSTIAKASHIRKYKISQGGMPDTSALVKLLDNQFVRNGQFTVLPFPFKYINENINVEIN